MDRDQVEVALTRAVEIDAAVEPAEPTFDLPTVQRLADELGVSSEAIARAIGETTVPEAGPINAVAHATIPAPAPEVDRALESLLRLRGLQPVGSGVWQQASGWWPDLFRFRAVTPVAVTVAPGYGGTVVSLTARLDRVWRVHLAAAVLVPLVTALALLGAVGVGDLAGGLVAALAWVGSCAWGYQYRRESIRRRLAAALGDIAEPAYRRQPW